MCNCSFVNLDIYVCIHNLGFANLYLKVCICELCFVDLQTHFHKLAKIFLHMCEEAVTFAIPCVQTVRAHAPKYFCHTACESEFARLCIQSLLAKDKNVY